PSCGEEMEKWDNTVYECPDCGVMIDSDIFEEEV
ncbi:hypothetical protein MCOL2_20992, partial [Listeria fleischmannii FSL S10-1203]